MRRTKLLKHLKKHSCARLREGAKHTVYCKPGTALQTTVPRHTEVHASLVRKICKDMDIPEPSEK
jgi:hypothetical protein